MGTYNRQSDVNDLELVEAFRSNQDMEILGLLWGRHLKMILALSMKYLGNKDNAKDATSEVFIELHEKILKHEIKNFKNWLYVLVKNFCLQRIRKEKGIHEVDIDEKKIEHEFVENPGFEHLIDERESETQRLQEAMQKLKEPQRVCLEYFYLHEKSYKEIADLTGYELGQVKSNIQNGKRNLFSDLSGNI